MFIYLMSILFLDQPEEPRKGEGKFHSPSSHPIDRLCSLWILKQNVLRSQLSSLRVRLIFQILDYVNLDQSELSTYSRNTEMVLKYP